MSHISPALFLARKRGEVVGRIAAFTNALHDEVHGGNAGWFGFFDCIEDAEVGSALLGAAMAHLRNLGRDRVLGPANWSVTEEVGLQIDGFDHPNILLTPYSPPWLQGYVEAAGLSKEVDLLAFQADLNAGYPRPPMTRRMVALAERSERLRFRDVKAKDFKGDVKRALAIFADAWADNWNMLPYTQKQVEAFSGELRPLMFKGGFRFVELDGEPIAFGVMLPNLYEATAGSDGHMTPAAIMRTVSRVRGGRIKQARIPLMGLRREHHNTKLGLAGVAKLCEDLFAAGRERGFSHCELSWILEDNHSMIRICEEASAEAYKRYRMFGKAL